MIYEEMMKPTLEDFGRDGNITEKAVLRMLENIACYHSDSLGYGVATMNETMISWILLEWKVRILRIPKYGESLRAATWSRGKATLFTTYRDFELFGEAGDVCAVASSKWALIDLHTKKPAVIGEELIEKYQTDERYVFEKPDIERLREPREYTDVTELHVGRRDIDLNGHVHNLCYLDFAYEALPEKTYQNGGFHDIRITYRKEIVPQERIACKYIYGDGVHTVGIYGEDGTLRSLVALS